MGAAHFNQIGLERNFKKRMEVGVRKSSDYGGTADGIAICGVEGIATRLVDKVLRVHSLTRPGAKRKVKDETIRDTFQDIANYADYAVALLDGIWGKKEKRGKKNPNAKNI